MNSERISEALGQDLIDQIEDLSRESARRAIASQTPEDAASFEALLCLFLSAGLFEQDPYPSLESRLATSKVNLERWLSRIKSGQKDESAKANDSIPNVTVSSTPVKGVLQDSVSVLALDSIEHRTVITDEGYYCVLSNRSNAQYYGLSPEEMTGYHATHFIGARRYLGREKQFHEAAMCGRRVLYNAVLDTRVGQSIPTEITMDPFRDHIGCVRGVVIQHRVLNQDEQRIAQFVPIELRPRQSSH